MGLPAFTEKYISDILSQRATEDFIDFLQSVLHTGEDMSLVGFALKHNALEIFSTNSEIIHLLLSISEKEQQNPFNDLLRLCLSDVPEISSYAFDYLKKSIEHDPKSPAITNNPTLCSVETFIKYGDIESVLNVLKLITNLIENDIWLPLFLRIVYHVKEKLKTADKMDKSIVKVLRKLCYAYDSTFSDKEDDDDFLKEVEKWKKEREAILKLIHEKEEELKQLQ